MASFPAWSWRLRRPLACLSRQKPANTRHGNDAPAIACKRFCGWRRNAPSKGLMDGLELPRIYESALLEAIADHLHRLTYINQRRNRAPQPRLEFVTPRGRSRRAVSFIDFRKTLDRRAFSKKHIMRFKL